ncbi:unnamed protein product, partial [marine sediment metagenome]
SGKNFNIICTESRPANEGFCLAEKLGKEEIKVKLIVDSASFSLLPEIQLILVGADALSTQGLVNKIGTLGLALAAKKFKVDIHVLCITQFASKLKVKSLGILYLIIPLGAFCEPDEKQLRNAKTSSRMRVYAAGPTSNFTVVLISILLFSFVFMPAVQHAADGIGIISVGKDTPAEEFDIQSGMIITHINDTKINTFYDFFIVMNNTWANQTVNISYVGQENYTKSVVLSDKYNEYEKRNPESNNKSYMGKGYLGVGPNPFIDFLPILKNPFSDFPNNFLLFYIIPLLGLDGYNPIYSPFTDSYIITGPLSFIPSNIFWVIVSALYWIFWLNLAVGLFNVLPMIPLDGGFLFNDAIGSFIRRVKKNLSDEKREKIVKNVSLVTSLLILFMVLFPWLVKYF